MNDSMNSVKLIHESRLKQQNSNQALLNDDSSTSSIKTENFHLRNKRNKSAVSVHKALQSRREALAKSLKNQEYRNFLRFQPFVLANLITQANLVELLRDEHSSVQELKRHLDEFIQLVDVYLSALEVLVTTEERVLETPEGEFLLERRVQAVLHGFDNIQKKSKDSPWKALIENSQEEVENCDKQLGKLEKIFLGIGAGGSVVGLAGIGLAIAFSPFTAGLTLFAAVPSIGLMVSSGVLSGVSVASFMTGALCWRKKRKSLKDILAALALLEEALGKELQKWLKDMSLDVCANIPEELSRVFDQLAHHKNRICLLCLDIPGGWDNIDTDPDAVLIDYPDIDVEEVYCRGCIVPVINMQQLSPITRKEVRLDMLKKERSLNNDIKRLKATFRAALTEINKRLVLESTDVSSTL